MNEDKQLVRPMGERRARREAERRLLEETGQLPIVDQYVPTLPVQRPPVPGGRRARRLAERSGGDRMVPGQRDGSADRTGRTGQVRGPVAPPTADRSTADTDAAATRAQVEASLAELARVVHGVAALPNEAPGGDPLTWDEVFATGVGLAPEPDDPQRFRIERATAGQDVQPGWHYDPRSGSGSVFGADDARSPVRVPSRLRQAWNGLERRTRVVASVVTICLVLGGGAVVGVRLAGQEAPRPVPVAAVVHQSTMLIGLVTTPDDGTPAPSRSLLSAALVAVDDASGDAVSLLAPGSLILDVPGAGKQTLADAVRSGDEAPANALSDALEVRIDGSWLLAPSDLTSLVNAVGGITVSVTAPVSAQGYTFSVGEQTLDGVAAAAYVTARTEDEPEQGQLARFEQVLGAVFAALPEAKPQIEALVAGGQLRTGTFEPGPLAERLVDLRRQAATGAGIASTLLPFEPLTVGDTTVSSLDEATVEDVVGRWLKGAKLAESGSGPVRVLVQNGVGSPGLSDAARKRLIDQGLRFVAGGNAQSFDYETTKVVVASDTPEDRERAQRVIEALKVPQATVVVDPLGSSLAEVVAVIGADFAKSITDEGVLGP